MQELYAQPVAGPLDKYDEQPPLTEGQRVTNMFAAPSRTFADIRRNRSWWLPLLVLAVFSYLFAFAALTRVGPDRMAETSIRSNPAQNEKMQQASPEQRVQTLRITSAIMKFSLYLSPLFLLLTTAIGALLLWVGFNFILGGSGTYPGMFAVVMFSWVPTAIKSALIGVMLFLGDADTFNISDPVGTNPGFYMGADSSVFLKTFLSSADLFTLWSLALMGIGAAIVSRVKVRSGLIMVFVVWLVFALGKAAITAATS